MRFTIFLMVATACLGSVGVEPDRADTLAFLKNYRISNYLTAATELQRLKPDERADRLRALAVDPKRASEVFPLCRMLFEARPKQEFRRPQIGSAHFVDCRDYVDWSLEPITIHKGVPVLVVRDYAIQGQAEPPSHYVEYCLEACAWRDTQYEAIAGEKLKVIVRDFLAVNPTCKANAQWFLDQAE